MKKASRARRLFSAGLLLTAANFLSKLLGFLRDVLISNYYGSTARTDAFFLAFSIPTILIGIFTSSTDSAIIPQYTRILSGGEDGRGQADRYFSNIVSMLTVAGAAVGLACLLFPEAVVFAFAPSFQAGQREMACGYLRIFSFTGLLHIWFCFFCSYLFCHEKANTRIFLTASTNVLVVLALLFIHDGGMLGLSLAYLAGSLLAALLPVWSARRIGWRYSPSLSLRNYGFPDFIRQFLPIMGSALLADLLLYLDRFLTTFLPAGNLSALNYASKVITIFDSISVVGISAVLLPVFSRLQVEKKYDTLRFTSSAVYFCTGVALLPLAVFAVLYARTLVDFLYLRGEFTAENAQAVSGAFRAYAPGVLLSPLFALLAKTLHSMGDTRFPFRVSLCTFLINAALSAALTLPLGISGIAFATTVSQLAGCGLLLRKLRKQPGLAAEFFRPANAGKLLLCGAAPLLSWRLLPPLSTPFRTLLLAGPAALALYFALALFLFRKELALCKNALKG